MYFKKNHMFLCLSILLLIIAGCSGNTAPSSVTGPYKVTGDKMLEASFVKDSPVALESDPYGAGEEIDVLVELTNKHTEDIPEGNVRVRLTGDAAIPNFFAGAYESIAPLLKAYDSEVSQATPEEIDVGPLTYVGEIPTKTLKKITGQYCYTYPVKAKAFLYYTDKTDQIGTTLPTGSNPPSSVQIIALKQQAVDVRGGEGKLRFSVTVHNKGSGVLVPTINDCFQYRGRTEREFVTLLAQGAYPITCDNDGIVRLSKDTKQKIVNCEVIGIDPSNLGNQPSELSLTLTGFAYQDEISPVTIWVEP